MFKFINWYIYIPLKLSQALNNLYKDLKESGYNLFEKNDKFYQDICTPYKSSHGTDIILADRLYYYYYNNETKCQSNCEFSYYYIDKQYLKCYCDTSNSVINTNNSKKFNPKIIYKSFYDVLKFSNYKVLKCYQLIFILDNLMHNIISLIIILFVFLCFIDMILYLIKGNNEIISKLKEIKNNTNKNEINELGNNIKIIDKNYNEFKLNSIKNEKNQKSNISINISSTEKNYSYKKRRLNLKADSTILIQSKNDIKIISDKLPENKKNFISSKSQFKDLKKDKLSRKRKINYNSKNNEKLDNYELDNLEYKQAIKLDKRKINEIYWSFLKREHLIIFTFCNDKDYNIKYIKFVRLILIICTDMALNVFFFADETMHKMFLDYGKYNFIQHIPQMIYSTIVSQVIQILINFLSLIDKHFYEIKKIKTNKEIRKKKIIKCIKIKIIYFFLFSFFMLAFYWYTISCFCAVYKNVQFAFIKDSFISFCAGLLYPFILYLFSSLLRKISLTFRKKIIYKFSNIIPFF